MKMHFGRLLAVAILITVGTGVVSAKAKEDRVKKIDYKEESILKKKKEDSDKGQRKGTIAAPEIDAASGTSAITLLTGAVLLAGERSRRSRTGKDDENQGEK